MKIVFLCYKTVNEKKISLLEMNCLPIMISRKGLGRELISVPDCTPIIKHKYTYLNMVNF